MWTLELFYKNDASMFVVSSPILCGKTLNRIARARKGRCGWQGTPSTDYSCETGISTWHQALSLLRAELLTRFTTPVITPSPPYQRKSFWLFLVSEKPTLSMSTNALQWGVAAPHWMSLQRNELVNVQKGFVWKILQHCPWSVHVRHVEIVALEHIVILCCLLV